MQRMRPHIQTPEPDHREKEARKLRLAPIPGGVGADTQARSTDQARKGGGWEAPGNASRAEGFSGDATKPGNASGDSGHERSVCKHVLLELPVPFIHTGFLNRVLTWLLKGPTIIASSSRYSYNFSLNFFHIYLLKQPPFASLLALSQFPEITVRDVLTLNIHKKAYFLGVGCFRMAKKRKSTCNLIFSLKMWGLCRRNILPENSILRCYHV